MAVLGTIMFQDDGVVTAGAVRGWKIGFGYPGAKGTVVVVYRVDQPATATEIPKLGNGKVDVNAVTTYLSGFGISLTNALRQVIGA